MKRAYIWAAVFSILGIGLGILVLLGVPMPLEVRLTLALGVGIALLYIGAAIVFLLALKGYKYRLKVAYRYVCTSMFLVSLGTLQFLFIGALDALDSGWVTQGGARVPFALMALFAYLGVRMFAKLVEVESIFTNIWVGMTTAIGIGVLAFFGAGWINPSHALETSMALEAYQATALAATAVLMVNIRRVTGPLYSSALGWSSVFYLLLAITGFGAIISELVLPNDHWFHTYSIGTMPYFVGGLLAMVTALYFNRVAYAENIQGVSVSADQAAKEPATSIDVVIFLAGFASNTNQIDPILDKMRGITATMGSDKRLTDDQQKTLASVYKEIEDFLVTSEPVRQYQKQELRQMVELRFRQTVDERFWQAVQTI